MKRRDTGAEHVRYVRRPYKPEVAGSTPAAPIIESCPTPSKVRYSGKVEALAVARAVQGMRAYRCSCGAWHLSSRRR